MTSALSNDRCWSCRKAFHAQETHIDSHDPPRVQIVDVAPGEWTRCTTSRLGGASPQTHQQTQNRDPSIRLNEYAVGGGGGRSGFQHWPLLLLSYERKMFPLSYTWISLSADKALSRRRTCCCPPWAASLLSRCLLLSFLLFCPTLQCSHSLVHSPTSTRSPPEYQRWWTVLWYRRGWRWRVGARLCRRTVAWPWIKSIIYHDTANLRHGGGPFWGLDLLKVSFPTLPYNCWRVDCWKLLESYHPSQSRIFLQGTSCRLFVI